MAIPLRKSPSNAPPKLKSLRPRQPFCLRQGSKMSESSETETVGYKRPPIKTQFKPGNSGNPRGRPPKSKVNMGQSLSEALDAKILVTSFQKPMTGQKALVQSLVDRVL